MHPPKVICRRIKAELLRQGLQANSDQIIESLANQGLAVDADVVQRVRIELLKEQGAAQQIDGFSIKPDKRKVRPQKVPEKRPQRR